MVHIINLEEFERQLIDRVIAVYKLPLELIIGPDESTAIDSDYFYNCDTDERLYLEDGLDYILEAINADDRELFCEEFNETEQTVLLRIMAELGLTTETMWKNHDLRQTMPKWQKRIELPLEGKGKNGETYKLVAQRWNTAPGQDEIDIFIEDCFGTVIQDVVSVEPTVKSWTTNPVEREDKMASVKVYSDEKDEDYTYIYDIKVYEEE